METAILAGVASLLVLQAMTWWVVIGIYFGNYHAPRKP